MKVWIAWIILAHRHEEAKTTVQKTRPKRPKKLKVERRGSPKRDRSRSRVRNMLKKD
jgi:hypothetical protein